MSAPTIIHTGRCRSGARLVLFRCWLALLEPKAAKPQSATVCTLCPSGLRGVNDPYTRRQSIEPAATPRPLQPCQRVSTTLVCSAASLRPSCCALQSSMSPQVYYNYIPSSLAVLRILHCSSVLLLPRFAFRLHSTIYTSTCDRRPSCPISSRSPSPSGQLAGFKRSPTPSLPV